MPKLVKYGILIKEIKKLNIQDGGEEMPILDSIKEAEAKAEQIKAAASHEAKELLEKTKNEANQEAEQLKREAEVKIQKMNEATKQQIVKTQAEIIKQSDLENEHNRQLAKAQTNKVVDLIIERVLKA